MTTETYFHRQPTNMDLFELGVNLCRILSERKKSGHGCGERRPDKYTAGALHHLPNRRGATSRAQGVHVANVAVQR